MTVNAMERRPPPGSLTAVIFPVPRITLERDVLPCGAL